MGNIITVLRSLVSILTYYKMSTFFGVLIYGFAAQETLLLLMLKTDVVYYIGENVLMSKNSA